MPSPYLATVFEPEAKAKGLHLLKDDLAFIDRVIAKVPYNERKRVLNDYILKWYECLGEGKNVSYSQNLGRKRANLYLLGVVS